ncbi:MAG TPA: hypothetical protein VK994_07725 [Bacteroidales bacterium]|nr:hypothetical protein [Bacteroidales bacterium]
MKGVILLIILLLAGNFIVAQETCSDIIYLPDGESMIFKCCVDKIEDGNLVFYTRDGLQDTTRASAVSVDGNYIELRLPGQGNAGELEPIPLQGEPSLYKGHDYSYYQREFERATLQKHIGIVLTFAGAFAELTGYIFLVSNTSEGYKQPMGAILFVAGIMMESVGIPLWISGGVKRANNRKAMEDMVKHKLSLKPTAHGIGLVLQF